MKKDYLIILLHVLVEDQMLRIILFFLNDYDVKIIGVEAGGEGVNSKNMLHLLQRVNLVFFMEIILIYYKIQWTD